MPKVLVSNNSELLRHLQAAPFRRLGLQLIVASSGEDVLEKAKRHQPALVILDAELPGVSGYEATAALREIQSDVKVVLVVGKRITHDQMHRLSDSGCDEILVAPMSSNELYDVVAFRLDLPRRGSERYSIDMAVIGSDGARVLDGRVSNLSVDGARMVLPEALPEGSEVELTITPTEGDVEPIVVRGRLVWSQPRDGEAVCGAAFEGVDDEVRARLSRLTQWEIVEETERIRVVIKGDITEATSFRDLLPVMVGRVAFDLSNVEYMNSLGVREWCNFLKQASIQGYEFHACSVPFVLQASLVNDVVGRGTIISFFAPYHCDECDHEENRLLQSATILASEDHAPPLFGCPECGGQMALDDIPERYLAFLLGDEDSAGADDAG